MEVDRLLEGSSPYAFTKEATKVCDVIWRVWPTFFWSSRPEFFCWYLYVVYMSFTNCEEVLKDYGRLTIALKKCFAPTTSPFELRFHLWRHRQKDRQTFDSYTEAQAIKPFPNLTKGGTSKDHQIDGSPQGIFANANAPNCTEPWCCHPECRCWCASSDLTVL